MKIVAILVLCAVAVALGVVAWRAPARDYVAPTIAEVEAHAPAPESLVGDVPADCFVKSFDVAGMCCRGCTGKIYRKIKEDPAVVQAAVSFEQGKVDLVVRKDADIAAIERELSFDKYTAKVRL